MFNSISKLRSAKSNMPEKENEKVDDYLDL